MTDAMKPRRRYTLRWGQFRLELGRRTCVMGIVNVTPDSFSDGGKYFSPDAAIAHGERLAAEGADIVDVGGESTRPFSDPISADEEIRRVVPIIETLAARIPVPISIDTCKGAVAEHALRAGAAMINDVSALRLDPKLIDVAGESDVPVILMHMLGTPRTMQVDPRYDDLLADIHRFLADAADRAENNGISRNRLILDPGIGFGKTLNHNLFLLQRLNVFRDLGTPLLVGPSRKAFIRQLLHTPGGPEPHPLDPIVKTGTHAAVAAAVINGAHIVRVHDVAGVRATLRVIDAVQGAQLEAPETSYETPP
jgi:dihydropteroate synthase